MTSEITRFTAPQRRFLRDLLDDEGQWSGMWTCRRNRKSTALGLHADGFITPILLGVTDDDGFTAEPERYRFGWRLTDAGVIDVHADEPDAFAWVTQSGKHARPSAGGCVMDPEKRDRWLALVSNSAPAIAEFWVNGWLVRYTDSWQWKCEDSWLDAGDKVKRSIAEHLAAHCTGDGWPSHEADRSLPHMTLGEALGLADGS